MKKKAFILSLLSVFILAGCTAEESVNDEETVDRVEEVETEDNSIEDEAVEEVEEFEQESEEVEESVEDSVDSRMERILFAEAVLTESFEGVGTVSYDYELDIIGITPTDPAFVDDIYHIMIGVTDKSAWNSLVGNVAELSIVISDIVDSDIQVAILNPESTDRVLLLVQDGFVIYDFADEI